MYLWVTKFYSINKDLEYQAINVLPSTNIIIQDFIAWPENAAPISISSNSWNLNFDLIIVSNSVQLPGKIYGSGGRPVTSGDPGNSDWGCRDSFNDA